MAAESASMARSALIELEGRRDRERICHNRRRLVGETIAKPLLQKHECEWPSCVCSNLGVVQFVPQEISTVWRHIDRKRHMWAGGILLVAALLPLFFTIADMPMQHAQ